ncbi:MAG: M1 family metallopeptidase [Saprospiraceae bacterium]|nr:M1 family metallopeptidase [Saprospiraceae bacterium]
MIRLNKLLFCCYCLLLLFPTPLNGQFDFYAAETFTRADTLRGMLRPERTCYDVHYYDLEVDVFPAKQSIKGKVEIHFRAVTAFDRLQIDLFDNMKLSAVSFEGENLKFVRIDHAVFIQFPPQPKGKEAFFTAFFEGQPIAAENPPWDGGFVWRKSANNSPWIGVACEGVGASLWWPNKDHLSDEPDSMRIHVGVPKSLYAVSNGELEGSEENGDRLMYHWFVSYPINNYNVTLNIAEYTHWQETYRAKDGSTMPLDYYVLKENEGKAKKHFQQVPEVLSCFEQYFGKYPFWDDGYALVETPYLGMEHQGAIAYGNRYMRGYLGTMIPRHMDWDYIIVHETGHEYFGNSISCKDHAEMWIHESFTTYMEALFIECKYGYKDAVSYLQSQRAYVENQEPILGPMNVNWDRWKGSDHYYKGALILHTLRSVFNDDDLWFKTLKELHTKHKISHMTSAEVIAHFDRKTKQDLKPFFLQYLGYAKIPCLIYDVKQHRRGTTVAYKWEADVPNFNMPVQIGAPGKYKTVFPKTNEWQEIKLPKMREDQFKVAKELYLVRSRPK